MGAAVVGLVGSIALGQRSEQKKAIGDKTVHTQKQVEALLAKPVGYFLTVEKKGRDEVVQVAREPDGEKTTLKVLINYPFAESADNTLGKVGVTVPVGWKQVQFEEGAYATYDATVSDAKAMATFLDAIFSRLLKWQPDSFAVEKM